MSQLQYVKHEDIDFEKWDSTILSSQLPFVFAQSFYLNATSPGWDALIVDNYESVFPLTHKTKFGYRYLPQPPFTSQLGAFGKFSSETEQLFYDYIITHFKLIEIELNATNQLQSEFISPKNTFTIDYSEGHKFNSNTKRNLAKAKENNFTVQQVAKNEIPVLSKTYLNPFLKDSLHLPDAVVAKMDVLISNAGQAGYLSTFKVTNVKGELKALGHFICNGKHALFLKGTSLDKSDNSGSMHLLMAYAIEFFADKALFFDFGGGSNSVGLANFYQGFGGKIMEYKFLKVNHLPRLIKFIKNKK